MNEVYTDLEKVSGYDVLKKIADYGTLERTILKVVEETTELNEVLVKTITKRQDLKPPVDKIIEEMGDSIARMTVLSTKLGINNHVAARIDEKIAQVSRWIDEQEI